MKDQQIKDLTNTLLFNYDMSEEFAKGLAEFLYDEGYRKLEETQRTIHVGSKYICSNCGKLASMENYCSRCGAKVIEHKESNSLDTLFDEADMGTCSNKTYNDKGLVTIS